MRIVDVLAAILYPPGCPLCGRDLLRLARGGSRLCRGCDRSLGRIVRACARCAEPGAAPLCETCARRPPPFGRVVACFPYREDAPGARAIRRWKYDGDLPLGAALSRCLVERSPWRPTCYDLVVPVPLHPGRYRTRGFNQAAVLAHAVARCDSTAGRFAPGVLARTQATERQARLGLRQRAGNVEAAFVARRALDGSAILLVDDVLTTGATARVCSRVLLDAGARDVDVVVLARTPSTAKERA